MFKKGLFVFIVLFVVILSNMTVFAKEDKRGKTDITSDSNKVLFSVTEIRELNYYKNNICKSYMDQCALRKAIFCYINEETNDIYVYKFGFWGNCTLCLEFNSEDVDPIQFLNKYFSRYYFVKAENSEELEEEFINDFGVSRTMFNKYCNGIIY